MSHRFHNSYSWSLQNNGDNKRSQGVHNNNNQNNNNNTTHFKYCKRDYQLISVPLKFTFSPLSVMSSLFLSPSLRHCADELPLATFKLISFDKDLEEEEEGKKRA